MKEEDQNRGTGNNRLRNLAILYLLVIVAVFLAGFLPMWSRARAHEKVANEQKSELRVLRLQTLLANAVIDARRGDYEPARQAASEFFTRISGSNEGFTSVQMDQLSDLLKQRDEIITLLARSDPASAERLSNLYLALRSAIGRQIELTAPVPSAPAAPSPETNAEPVSTNQ
ncbi:MAG: hypothetical protein ACO1QB_12530 [Verrucomicrobiales bacterium]